MSSSIVRLKTAARLRLTDTVRYANATSEVIAAAKSVRAQFTKDAGTRLAYLTSAYRLTSRRSLERRLLERLAPSLGGAQHAEWAESRIGWHQYPGAVQNPELDRTILLKAPGPNGEKGVLLIMLEYNFLKLLAHGGAGLEFVDQNYDIIVSTGWSPTDYWLLGLGVTSLKNKFFVQSCNYGEIEKIERFHPRVKCLSTIACDWIHPQCFKPKPFAEREYDLLMVANWAPFKRHWDLFLALAELPANLRIAMIGQPDAGHTLERVRRQAKALGVRQDIEFLDCVPIETVQAFQANSKASLILSRREGCCVAVVESLFADSPVGLMRNGHVGPNAYINPETGVLLDSAKMGRQLREFLERAGECRAREWATRNISCFQSIDKLTATLRDHADSEGRPWTNGLKMPVWRPYPTYVSATVAEELRPAHDELHRRIPKLFTDKLFASTIRAPELADSPSLA